MIHKTLIKLSPLCIAILLSSCSSLPNKVQNETDSVLTVNNSYLQSNDNTFSESDVVENDHKGEQGEKPGINKLASIPRGDVLFKSAQLAQHFSDQKMVNVAANNMLVKDFIHYVYGELLSVNYLLAPEVDQSNQKVTLSLKENISQRRLFTLADSVLSDRDLNLKYDDNVYLISKTVANSKSGTVVGMGRSLETIPSRNSKIMQVVPILYGIKTSLKNTIEQLADVSVTIDVKQSALFVTGDYANVSRALELVQLLDSPANRGRYIGLVKLVYSSPDVYLQQIATLLENEGVPNSINTPDNNNLVFVPLQQIGAVAVFSATEDLYKRVEFWTKMLDKPSEGDVQQYYVFHPKFARAQDIGESLTPLISARGANTVSKVEVSAATNKADEKASGTGQLSKANRKAGGSNGAMTFVVDERSNAIIFYTTGTEYRNIIQLINRLDVLPKQVMLDIVIAEVTLTDDFKFGVEWAIKNGKFGAGTFGALGVAKFGGLGMLFNNEQGDMLQAAFNQQNSNIKVLSNPSILVRDGVTASLDIGEDISIVGSTTEGFNDNDRVTTTSTYRRTGVSISVTPTINAQGVVIMEIQESISNQAESNSGAGNPNIFERNLTTEVVAESGQTIILGGLIDDKKTIVENKVPGLGDLPLLGHLFRSSSDSIKRTELVLMVTPKVINRTDQWQLIKSSFQQNLTNLDVVEK